ncbi:MAG: DUF5606 domain-containing protein [Bacteroidetes bacterium]|nr:DUF5606 domain-containing protein [Bacteroidota bacterium]
MNYSKLVSVTGLGGLFELVSTKADGGIVRSLEDKSTKFVSNRIHNFSHLESIEVYTTKENVGLTDVFLAMQNSEEKLPDAKADVKAIKAYFEKVYPDMDFDRVYTSDMKKMIKWFSIIKANNIEIKASELEHKEVETEPEKKQSVKSSSAKQTTVKSAPAKKINVPRKMA